MNFGIFQMEHNENTRYNIFMPYKYNAPINPHLYKQVWHGEISDKGGIEATLGYLFEVFNIRHPEGYKGRSMSVSDIVVLDGDCYYVDSFGWVKIEEWGE